VTAESLNSGKRRGGGKYIFAVTNQRATIEKLLKAAFSMRTTQKLTKTIAESDGSQNRHTVKYGHESLGTRNKESMFWREPAAI
jgi:hypothetical protein